MKRKGFTLIELMIVIAIIAIIAAVAIPNLLQSRIRANEGSTQASLREIGTAQLLFEGRGFARLIPSSTVATSGYSENYRNLYYAPDPTRNDSPVALITQQYVDAALDETGKAVTATLGSPLPSGTPHNGYLYANPSDTPEDVNDAPFFQYSYGLIAVPASAGNTGTKVFVLTSDGSVKYADILSSELPVGSSADDIWDHYDVTPVGDPEAEWAS